MKMHQKLMLSMLLLGLVPVVIMTSVSVIHGENILVRNITEEMHIVAEEKARDVEKAFENNIREVSILAEHPQIINALRAANLRQVDRGDELPKSIEQIDKKWIKHKGNTEEARAIANNPLSRFLKNYQDRDPGRYGEIFVTDRYGAVVSMTNTLSDYYQADEQWWHGANNGGKGYVFIDDRGYDKSAGAVVAGVAVPVWDGPTVSGVVKISFKLEGLFDEARLLETDQYGHAIISRHDGFVLFSSDPIEHKQEELHKEHTKARQHPVVENQEHGQPIIAAHAIVQPPYPIMARLVSSDGVKSEIWTPTQWHIVLHTHKNIAFLPITRLYYWSFTVATLVVIAAWLIGARLSRVISEPLEKLHNGIAQVANGDLGHRVSSGIGTGGEICDLARAFDNMTAHLQETLTTRDKLQKEIERRKAFEAKLSDSEQRFRSAFEQAAVGIAHVAPDGHWLRVNQRLCNITGYSEAELLQKTFQDITHPDDLDIDLAHVQALLAGKSSDYSMEKRYICKDGSMVWINLTMALVCKPDGSPEYFVSVIEDIDEKRQMKESLYKLNKKLEQRITERTRELSTSNQKLEASLKKLYQAEEQMLQAEKMAAMGTFAAGIAHELNNPLTGVLNYVQYTRDKIDDEKLKGYLDKAEHNTLRAAKVIENMLAYSRQSQPGEEAINIATVIEQSVDIMRPELNREHIALELDLEPALPPVKANADTLGQVFINLMGNARDAMEEQADKRIGIRAVEQDNNIQVTIKDTGEGIPGHVGGKIFDPFFTTKPPGKGTGLGLGLCQRIISNLGGTIRFDSDEGQGTTFYIHIPVINQTSWQN
jgi:PAS domain S-box-containing protein